MAERQKTMKMTILDGFIVNVTKDGDNLIIRVVGLGKMYDDLIRLGIDETSKRNVFAQRLMITPVKKIALGNGEITPEF